MFPEAFGHLRDSAIHSAERAWTALGHFFVCQSILALAWAQVYVAAPDKSIARLCVLIAISQLPPKPWRLPQEKAKSE
jgi:hypothetical protein